MEYLQVFDDNKEMLSERVERYDKYDLPDGKYFMVILIFIENDDGKFLFQKTSKARGSDIAVTSGHVTFGDDGVSTVIREASEELNLKLEPDEIEYVATFVYRNCFIETYYTHKNFNIEDLTIQKDEVDYVKWFSINEIAELIKEDEFRIGNIKPFQYVLNYRKTK